MGRTLVAGAAVTFVLLGAGPASAVPPVEVEDRITDEVDALGDGAAEARDAVQELSAETEIELYTVLVPAFDATSDAAWGEETARMSGLEGPDILLAVAVGEETYEYTWWVDESFPLSVVAVEDVMSTEVEPLLEAGDWSGAVVALAEQLETEAAAAGEGEETTAVGEADQETATGSWSATTTVVVIAGLAALLLIAHLLSRRRTAAGSAG